MQALGEAQSQFKVAYDQRIAEFKEQLSIARAAFELELSVKIDDFYQALQTALTRRAQGKIIYSLISSLSPTVSPKHPEMTAVASQEEEEDFPAPPQKRKKKVIAE